FIDKSFFGRVSAAVKARQILLSLFLHVVDTVYVDVKFVQFEERHRVASISFGSQFSILRMKSYPGWQMRQAAFLHATGAEGAGESVADCLPLPIGAPSDDRQRWKGRSSTAAIEASPRQ